MDHRQLVRTIAAGRVVIGSALVLLPGAAGSRAIGPVAHHGGVKVMVRAAGARDLAIGVGTLQALADGTPARSWALAGGVSDLVDAAAMVLAFRTVGARRAVPLILAGAVAGLASYSAAPHLD